ncbi:hypothetical protein DsansV1_C11g0113741 [Dioscorea sansibarensis]
MDRSPFPIDPQEVKRKRNGAHIQDHASEESTQINHGQEHEEQMEQEMGLEVELQDLDLIDYEYQQETNQNPIMKIGVAGPAMAIIANEDAFTSSAG